MRKSLRAKAKTIMKKHLLIAMLFLLTGCPGHGDRIVPRVTAKTIIKDNNVCIVSNINPEEKITSVQIYSDASDRFIRTFDSNPVYMMQEECLPVFNYVFSTGKRYSVFYNVTTPQAGSYLITADFSLVMDNRGNNRLYAEPLHD